MIQKKLSDKTLVLLALLAQLGPYPGRADTLKRSKVQIKINRLLATKRIESELNEREKLLFKALKEYWLNDNIKRKEMLATVLVSDLKKLINKNIKIRKKFVS